MEQEQKYPVGMQSFREIVEGGYVYVDKTWSIPLLERNKFYFLGRPRRFGKSLLLSMLMEYYAGNRHLFDGLAIARLRPGEWVRHPVFHIDLNGQNFGLPGSVSSNLDRQLTYYEKKYGIQGSKGTLSDRFIIIVEEACRQTGQKVVILIDEYDKPLTDNILNDELYGAHQAELRGFYSSLKTLDPCIKLALLTGVTKFGKLNVFSGLNNLYDISLSSEFSAICGITEAELHCYFDVGVARLADVLNIDKAEAYTRLKLRYDGYHFSELSPDIYNPFSLLSTLAGAKAKDYWFSTGTTKMLADLVVRNHIPVYDLEGSVCGEDEISDISLFGTNPIPLLYQTGYLTIQSYDPVFERYTLGYPNQEVKRGFLKEFLRDYSNTDTDSVFTAQNMSEMLNAGEATKFLETLQSFFASMPYDLRKYQSYESFWQTVMYVLLTMLGYHAEAEHHTSEGSIDLLVKTPGYIYVMELKVADRYRRKEKFIDEGDGVLVLCEPVTEYDMQNEENDSAEVRRVLDEAVRQIEERCYEASFAADGRKVIKMAVVFSAARHRIAMARIF